MYLIDTREKLPYSLKPAEPDALPAGDYSVRGYAGRKGEPAGIAIERKSMVDLHGCCGREHARFLEQLQRLAEFKRGFVVCETSPAELLEWYPVEAGGLTGEAMLKQVCRWSVSLGTRFIFASNRRVAARMTRALLDAFWRSSLRKELDEMWVLYQKGSNSGQS